MRPCPSPIQWRDELSLDMPLMDRTHQDFIALLARLDEAEDSDLRALWREMVDHTATHFGQEDGWMQRTGFATGNCHATQHQVVLDTLREAERQVAEGRYDNGLLRVLTRDLAKWFDQHAQAMDAALALHLRSVGFDPHTGEVALPGALPVQAIQGCGGACSTPGVTEPGQPQPVSA